MAEQIVILIERNGKKQFTRFIELFMRRQEIPLTEIRSTIPKSTFYDFILGKLHSINQAINKVSPKFEYFIKPTLYDHNNRVIQAFRKNHNIEIIAEDQDYFYLRLKDDGKECAVA